MDLSAFEHPRSLAIRRRKKAIQSKKDDENVHLIHPINQKEAEKKVS